MTTDWLQSPLLDISCTQLPRLVYPRLGTDREEEHMSVVPRKGQPAAVQDQPVRLLLLGTRLRSGPG